MNKFRRKSPPVTAIQYTGDNLAEVLEFTGKHPKWDEWFSSFDEYAQHVANDNMAFRIFGSYGQTDALPGYWIFRNCYGVISALEANAFAALYEPIH